jgi:hypothetical protein
MASVNKNKGLVLAGAGLGLLALLLWSYCGRVDGGQAPAVTKAPALIEPEPVFEEPVIPVVTPVAVLADEPTPLPPVAASPPSLERVPAVPVVAVAAVAAVPVAALTKPTVVKSPALPPVSAPPVVGEPIPDVDWLIARGASKRFTPDVAALASVGLTVGAPIQGDENSLNVLQPCDTSASACGAGMDPGQVIGGVNDWTGFVLPGF